MSDNEPRGLLLMAISAGQMNKELAEKLFIWAILEYNKVRIKYKKQNKVCSEDKLIDEAFAVWYENLKEFLNDKLN